MMNPNLDQALEQLRHEIQNEAHALMEKENAHKRLLEEDQALETATKTKSMELKRDEQEITRLKMEIQQATPRIAEMKRRERTLETEIAQLRREEASHNQEIREINTERTAAANATRRNSLRK